jgi:hypothetical protein
MNRVAIAFAALLAAGFAAASNDARAEAAGPVVTQRHASNQAAKQLPAAIEQARIEKSSAKTFIINGRRVLVPSDANAEAVIKALKERYPGLQADIREARSAVTTSEKK